MIQMTLSQIASITSGKLIGEDTLVKEVSRDSRQETHSGLFIALRGERFDAHLFIDDAISAGAVAAITEHEVSGINQVVVNNALVALQQISVWQRNQVDMQTVAITGSCGKTTVKGMLASILSRLGNTLVTPGNYNNHIGVPLTLLGLKGNESFGVIELGANHLGEIEEMVNWVQPDVALINCIAGAHLEGFGSIENVALAKGEIFKGLGKGDVAVLPADCAYSHLWQDVLEDKEVLKFGTCSSAIVRAADMAIGIDKSQFELIIAGESQNVSLNLGGQHNVHNALAAAACAYAIGIDIKNIALGLGDFFAVEGRSHHLMLSEGVELINDTYNANEASFRAAIDLLGLVDKERKTVMVMGEMGELGEYAERIHFDVGQYAKDTGVQHLLTYGPLTQFAVKGFTTNATHFNTKEDILKKLDDMTLANTTVLVKGSRSSGMESICDALKLRFTGEEK
jgi:UDP-N-acetylmuramoyl-tripeptide--D-alanyl-D-alanine ligase